MAEIRIKRIYGPAAADDGHRILVDRLWPRGISKQRAAVDFWARAVAPSDELRQWYRHEADKWPEFKRRYFAELQANGDGLAELREHLRQRAAAGPAHAGDAGAGEAGRRSARTRSGPAVVLGKARDRIETYTGLIRVLVTLR